MEKSLEEMVRRIVRSFLDIAILSVLKENEGLNGYEIIQYIHEKLGILVSQGTVYSNLYALERKQLVTGMTYSRARTYKLTSKGLDKLREVSKMRAALNLFLTQLCNDKMEQILPIQQRHFQSP